jgi:hypothetical protein
MPSRVIGVEVPPCPDPAHAGSERVRAGWYGSPGRRRQRWWCRPAGGELHRFVETLPRLCGHGASSTCRECATALEPWEGQPAPRLYGFSVRDVAAALVRVASGASYRSTAEAVRRRAGRPLAVPERRRGKKFADPNRHAQLVSDWVQVFGPVIWAAYAPTSWPSRVVLDDDDFRYVTRATSRRRGIRAFSVLGAVGYAAAGARPQTVRLEAVPQANTASWARFCRALSGRPALVVSDGGRAVLGGLRKAWPPDDPHGGGPWLFRCEWHLMRGVTDALRYADVQLGERLTSAARLALTSRENWISFETALRAEAARTGGLHGALHWAELNRDLVLAQAAHRDPRGPHSVGPLEEVFRHLENVLNDRVAKMTNKSRADTLLTLIAADLNGWADEAAWAEILREHLNSQGGRATHQRQAVDPAGAPTLRTPDSL